MWCWSANLILRRRRFTLRKSRPLHNKVVQGRPRWRILKSLDSSSILFLDLLFQDFPPSRAGFPCFKSWRRRAMARRRERSNLLRRRMISSSFEASRPLIELPDSAARMRASRKSATSSFKVTFVFMMNTDLRAALFCVHDGQRPRTGFFPAGSTWRGEAWLNWLTWRERPS
jgi:hypothetical protein